MMDENSIDLHGYSREEAIEALAETIETSKNRNRNNLTVITDKGIHSIGPPVLGPAVIQYAEENNLTWCPVVGNSGRIKLFFGAESDRDVEAQQISYRHYSREHCNPVVSWCATIAVTMTVGIMFYFLGKFVKIF